MGTKLTEAEYSALLTVARGEHLSQWIRRVILSVVTPTVTDQAILAEVLALRTIVLNLHYALVANELITPGRMQRLIDDADRDKLQQALARINALSRLP